LNNGDIFKTIVGLEHWYIPLLFQRGYYSF
jgi:hypothetical protein